MMPRVQKRGVDGKKRFQIQANEKKTVTGKSELTKSRKNLKSLYRTVKYRKEIREEDSLRDKKPGVRQPILRSAITLSGASGSVGRIRSGGAKRSSAGRTQRAGKK